MTTLTGSPVTNTAHGNSSQAVTIPADCTAVLVYSWGWRNATALDFATLNWDGAGMDFTQVVTNKSTTDQYDIWAYIMTSAAAAWPGTGSRTLAWTFNQAPTEGGTVVIVFLKDLDTDNPVVDTDSQKAGESFTSSLTSVAAEDLSFVTVVDYYGTGTPGASGSGQTTLASNVANDNGVDWIISYEAGETALVASGGQTSFQGEFTGYIAFSIRSTGGGGGFQSAWASVSNQVIW